MKQYTKEQIVEGLNDVWERYADEAPRTDYFYYNSDNFEVDVLNVDPDYVRVKVYAMYDAPPLNLASLKLLAEFFETTNINDDEHFQDGGCDTCDYGSAYGFTLVIRPGKSYAELLGHGTKA